MLAQLVDARVETWKRVQMIIRTRWLVAPGTMKSMPTLRIVPRGHGVPTIQETPPMIVDHDTVKRLQ